MKTHAKRTVAKAKEDAQKSLHGELGTKEGGKKIFRIAKAREKAARDLGGFKFTKNETGEMISKDEDALEGWAS